MTIPFWCLLAACILPYVWTSASVIAKKQQLGRVDNREPRAQAAKLSGWGARAIAAHQNAWEALGYFVPAVIVAHLSSANAIWSARLAIAFVVLRLLHGVVYLADMDKLRSVVFTVAIGCAIGLFLLAPLGV